MTLRRRLDRLERLQARPIRFVPDPGPARPLPPDAIARRDERVIILDTGVSRCRPETEAADAS